jgi:hypothetical protein
LATACSLGESAADRDFPLNCAEIGALALVHIIGPIAASK